MDIKNGEGDILKGERKHCTEIPSYEDIPPSCMPSKEVLFKGQITTLFSDNKFEEEKNGKCMNIWSFVNTLFILNVYTFSQLFSIAIRFSTVRVLFKGKLSVPSGSWKLTLTQILS